MIPSMSVLSEIRKLLASGLVAYTVHYGSEKFYDAMCTADGFSGFFQGLLTVASPWCTLALSTMTHTQSMYSNFVVFGASRLLVEFVDPLKPAGEVAGDGRQRSI
jgi:hypothetical protein